MEWSRDKASMRPRTTARCRCSQDRTATGLTTGAKMKLTSELMEKLHVKASLALALRNVHPIEDYVLPISPLASAAASDDWTGTCWPFSGIAPATFGSIGSNRTAMCGSSFSDLSDVPEFSPFQNVDRNIGSSSFNSANENMEVPGTPPKETVEYQDEAAQIPVRIRDADYDDDDDKIEDRGNNTTLGPGIMGELANFSRNRVFHWLGQVS